MENEKRLIDANALIEKKRKFCSGHGDYDYMVELWHIENAPTVDAVEVVRCKDCKHFDRLFKGEGAVNKIGTCCLREEEELQTAQSCDDFCSYGERKDNG